MQTKLDAMVDPSKQGSDPPTLERSFSSTAYDAVGISERHVVTRPRLDRDTVEFVAWDPSEFTTFGKTIHYKGFAGRLDFQDDVVQVEKKNAVDFFIEENPDTVVWDGDDHKQDSFTALIPDIYCNTHPRLVMFLRNTPEERQRVIKSWTQTKPPITCYLLSGDLSFEELGSEALKATHSKTVFCFGGGAVLEKEWLTASKDVRFVLARTCRNSPDPRDRRPSLDSHLVANIVQKMQSGNLKSASVSTELSVLRRVHSSHL
jgi:hypothetical protein